MNASALRIALIGNMNNNLFSVFRYFREIDINAELFCFEGEMEHFKPENDTVCFDQYKPYIHVLPLRNTPKDMFFLGKHELRTMLGSYDLFVGCGFSPIVINSLGRRLDLFIPYSNLIEGLEPVNGYEIFHIHWWIIRLVVKYLQKKALLKSRYITSAPWLEDRNAYLIKIKYPSERVLWTNIPIVYNKENHEYNMKTSEYIEKFKQSSMVLISHTRHEWKTFGKGFKGKKNDVLIEGFSKYVIKSNDKGALLVLCEYGPDVNASKALIKKLGIENQIVWIPLMPRKNIMALISNADIGADQFGEKFWGGVGWEILSEGLPLINRWDVGNDELKLMYEGNAPQVLRAYSADGVAEHLASVKYTKSSRSKNKKWFENYMGRELARNLFHIISKNR